MPLYEEPKVTPNEVCVSESDIVFERKMGDTELSYFLPSRQTGVNDMYVVYALGVRSPAHRFDCRYLHLGFRAPHTLVRRSRVNLVWAILRARHPLLSASVQMHDYDDVRFV